jgi:integrase
MKSLPKGVYVKRKVLADGTVKEYRYDRNATKAEPVYEKRKVLADGTVKVYSYSRKATKAEAKPSRSETCWRAIVDTYRGSPEYRDLAPGTRDRYQRQLERARQWDDFEIIDIRRRDVIKVRNAIAMRGTRQEADNFVAVIRAVISWAIDMDMAEDLEVNPLFRIKRARGGHFEPWTEEQLAFALAARDKGGRPIFCEEYRRAIILALYTGQRASDCVKMTWNHYDGSGILVQQQKTKRHASSVELWIPAHPELKRKLDAWKPVGATGKQTILLNARGLPWTARYLCNSVGKVIRRQPELRDNGDDKRGTVFHGLRVIAAVRLAEAKCTEHQIWSITGQSPEMIKLYTRRANQRLLAKSAMLKLVGGTVD